MSGDADRDGLSERMAGAARKRGAVTGVRNGSGGEASGAMVGRGRGAGLGLCFFLATRRHW